MTETNLPPQGFLAIEQMYINGQRWELLTSALQRHLEFDPKDFQAWIDLGFAQVALKHYDEFLASLRRSVEEGGDAARAVLRQDPRFAPVRQRPEFQALIVRTPSL